MLPMVTNSQEMAEVEEILKQAREELLSQNLPHAWPLPLGAMIETPASVLCCDSLAARSSFLSIGTNDLLHYIMAIDRGSRHVAYLNEPFHPAFLRALKLVADKGHEAGLKISVCGELAADPLGAVILLGLGIDILSVAPRFVPAVKQIIRGLDSRQCAAFVQNALNEWDAEATRAKAREILENAMGGSLAFHNNLPFQGKSDEKTGASVNSCK